MVVHGLYSHSCGDAVLVLSGYVVVKLVLRDLRVYRIGAEIQSRLNNRLVGVVLDVATDFILRFSPLDDFLYLVIFDVVPYKKLRESWRMIYIVLMILCAVVTPDASPITMLLMFAAMVALYELSLLIARIVLARRIKAQNAAMEEE